MVSALSNTTMKPTRRMSFLVCASFIVFVALFLQLTICLALIHDFQPTMVANSRVKLLPFNLLAVIVIILATNTLVVRIAASLALGVLLLG